MPDSDRSEPGLVGPSVMPCGHGMRAWHRPFDEDIPSRLRLGTAVCMAGHEYEVLGLTRRINDADEWKFGERITR